MEAFLLVIAKLRVGKEPGWTLLTKAVGPELVRLVAPGATDNAAAGGQPTEGGWGRASRKGVEV